MPKTDENLIERCRSPFAPTVLDVPALIADERVWLHSTLAGHGHFVARIDNARLTTAAELFDGMARECGFPDYFGRNWDALKDCLLDFSWQTPKPKGFALLFRNPQSLTWSDLGELICVCDEVRSIYAPRRIPFKLLFAREPSP